MSAFSALAQQVADSLGNAPALAGGRVFLNRLRPLPAGATTAVVVRLAGAALNQPQVGAVQWLVRVDLECYARGPSAAAEADLLLAAAWSRLLADQDLSAALSTSDQPAIQWQYDEESTDFVCATLSLYFERRLPLEQIN